MNMVQIKKQKKIENFVWFIYWCLKWFYIKDIDSSGICIYKYNIMINTVVEMIMSDHKDTAWIEGFAILVAVLISSGITTGNDYSK